MDVVERLPDRLLEVPVVVRLDEMNQALRVRLRDERVTACLELLPEAREVLDDPVVREGDLAVAVDVRLRIHLGRRPMGRPPGVGESRRPLDVRQLRLEVRDEPFVFDDLEGASDHGDARAVVAPILEALEAVEQDRQCVAPSRVPDDPAHLQDHRA